MQHLTCGISSLHSVNLILFTVPLVHLILHISPHHSHHLDLRSYHLSLPRPFTPNLSLSQILSSIVTLISFTNLNLYWIKGTLAFVCLNFFFIFFSATCARNSWMLSFLVYVKLCYRIISYRMHRPKSCNCQLDHVSVRSRHQTTLLNWHRSLQPLSVGVCDAANCLPQMMIKQLESGMVYWWIDWLSRV